MNLYRTLAQEHPCIILSWIRILTCCFLLLYSLQTKAFIISDIEVEGLEHITEGKIFSELPLKVGDEFNIERTSEIIHTLYKTGLFKDIVLLRDGDKLLIKITERPGIVGIEITGNNAFPVEGLLEGLEKANIAVGLIFDQTAFARLKQELKEQYYSLGRYATRINATVQELDNNQINLVINIYEGEVATIKQVKLIGNIIIKDDEILEELEIGASRWYDFLSSKDEYSYTKLAADIETIRNIYLNKGYLDIDIKDIRVSLTSDKEDIYIEIEISEGGRYRIGDINLSGKTEINKKLLKKQITFKRGQYFSRQKVVESSDNISYILKNNGYAFSEVNILPHKREDEGIVDIVFIINPKDKTYVHRINITGNKNTDDSALRRELRQLEGMQYSAKNIELSQRRLRRLPYISSVDISDSPVEDRPNQIDLDITVTERQSGSFNIGAGYSNNQGAVLTASVNQDNFLGSGNRVNFTFSNSKSDINYAVGFHNPYYTVEGISRSWNLSYRSVNYEERDIVDILSSSSNEIKANVSYGIPFTETDTFHLGAAVEQINTDLNQTEADRIRTTGTTLERDIIECLEGEDGSFSNFAVNTSLSYDTRDSTLFSTSGKRVVSNLQIYTPISDSKFFKIDNTYRQFIPLYTDITLGLKTRVAYGSAYSGSCIPFFSRLYTGGSKSVRGYANNSLGPLDNRGNPLGGNFMTTGSLDLYFPVDFLYDRRRLRMSLFTDIGNVYTDIDKFSVSELRGSYGLQIQWLTAIGGIGFNFAKQYNSQSTDSKEKFQFNLGTSF